MVNMRLTPPNDNSHRQFSGEASRKRKTINSDQDGNTSDTVSPIYWGHKRGNLEILLPRESSSHHNSVSLQVVDSQGRAPEIVNHNFQYIKPIKLQSEYGNYQHYNMNSFSMNMRTKDENGHKAAVESQKACMFIHKEPSLLIKTPLGEIPKLSDSRYAYDIASQPEVFKFHSYYNQSNDYMEKAALRAEDGMNHGHGTHNLPSNSSLYPCATSSQSLTFLESSQVGRDNEKFCQYANLDGRSYVQDFSESGLAEVKKSGQKTGYGVGGVISTGTANSIQSSIVSERKDPYGSYQYPKTEIRSANDPCNNFVGVHLDVKDDDRSGSIMLQIPVLAQSSSCEEPCFDNGRLTNTDHVSSDFDSKIVEKDDGANAENKNQSLGEETSLESDNSHAKRPVDLVDGLPSLHLDRQSKSVAGKASPVVIERLWDGSLQLNTSTTVSAVAFFKSGEKAPDVNWSEHVEIKGKVRLQAFEKYIQELPRSRNRSLMVISLCWKVGTSKTGLKGMKEVAKVYKESQRVGFAQPCTGVDLYVCPRSDTIITILAKSGFFKGMGAVEEDQNSLIGCAVWRRSCPSLNSVPKTSEKRKSPLSEQPIVSPESSIFQNAEMNSSLTHVQDSEPNHATPCTREPEGVSSPLISESRSTALDSARNITTESKIVQSSSEPHDTSSFPTNNLPEITTLIPDNSLHIPIQLPPAPKPNYSYQQDPVKCTEIPIMHIAEPKKPDLSFELKRPVLHEQPQMLQKPDSSSRQAPVEGISKAEIPIMHIANPKKPAMGSEPTWTALLGLPPLLPVQQIAQSVKDLHNFSGFHKNVITELPPLTPSASLFIPVQLPTTMKNSGSSAPLDPRGGISKAKIPITHIAEPKKTNMGFEPTQPSLPGPPKLLSQSKQSFADPDDDDLPEFDFDSACGVPRAPVSKFPWSSSHESHFLPPPFRKQLPVEGINSAGESTPLALPIVKSVEVAQRPQVASFPAIGLNRELISESKPAAWTTGSSSRSGIMKADKDSAIPSSCCNLPGKSCWNDDDDDDDMPEWCPPELENVDRPQPSMTTRLHSLILGPNTETELPRPPMLIQSPTSFPPQNQGFPHGYQPGILGKCPATNNPVGAVKARPVTGFVQSSPRPPSGLNPNQSLKPRTRISKFDIKPAPSNVGWRGRRS